MKHMTTHDPSEDTLVQTASQLEHSRELSTRDEAPPVRVHGYSFLRQLGEGAYGTVWLAREDNTGKLVSIKFYTNRRGLDWSLLNREVEKLAVLYTSHNIVGLLDVGWDNDPPYYVMEYLENGSLASYLAEGAIPVNDAVRLAKAIARGLVHAHGAGILHCDLKPANVLLDSNFDPRLCDFGQSRLTNEQNPALGTLFYMPHEQANLKAVPDARWDVYALGALLYQMLSGEPPHRTPDNEAKIRAAGSLRERLTAYGRILRDNPAPDKHRHTKGVDRRLAGIVDRCLKFDPEKRFPNAQAVLDELEQRDRGRARRPLVALGIVGPLLLLAAMTPIFKNFVDETADISEQGLVKLALDGNMMAANGFAFGLNKERVQRLDDLEAAAEEVAEVLASDEHFRTVSSRLATIVESANEADHQTLKDELSAIQRDEDMEERPEWVKALDAARKRAIVKYRRRQAAEQREAPEDVDASWFFIARSGHLVWRRKFGPVSIGYDFSFRDYFNGAGKDTPEELENLGIPRGTHITERHTSIPFKSLQTQMYIVAFSVPVMHDGEFLGVLARTIELAKLRRQLGKYISSETREIAMVDTRKWQLIDHPQLVKLLPKVAPESTREQLLERGEVADHLFEKLIFSESLQSELAGIGKAADWGEMRVEDYTDPVGHVASAYDDKWVASMARIPETDWMIIVQERKTTALAPVTQLKQYGWKLAIIALFVSATLLGVLWYFVSRALNNRSKDQWAMHAGTSSRPSTRSFSTTGSAHEPRDDSR